MDLYSSNLKFSWFLWMERDEIFNISSARWTYASFENFGGERRDIYRLYLDILLLFDGIIEYLTIDFRNRKDKSMTLRNSDIQNDN